MNSETREYIMGDIIQCTQGIQIPVEQQSNIKKDGMVRFLRIVDFTSDDEPPRFIAPVDKKYYKSQDELIMIRYGAAGKVFVEKEGAIANNMFKINIRKKFGDKVLVKYLYYYFLFNKTYQRIVRKSESGTIPAIKFDDIYSLRISLPEIRKQQDIINTLDIFVALKENLLNEIKYRDQQFDLCLEKYFDRSLDV